jgi:hypothetical protein
MTVIPFRRIGVTSSPTLALRVDLRTRLTAGTVPHREIRDSKDLTSIAQSRDQWRANNKAAPFILRPKEALYADASSAGDLAEMVASAGFEPARTDLELDETVLAATSLLGAERLRARGFGLSLKLASDCPLPLGGRERALFREFSTPAPTRIDPFLGCEGWQDHPLAARVFAAHAASIIVTALGVHDSVMARALVAAGFDRGQGEYAGYA